MHSVECLPGVVSRWTSVSTEFYHCMVMILCTGHGTALEIGHFILRMGRLVSLASLAADTLLGTTAHHTVHLLV